MPDRVKLIRTGVITPSNGLITPHPMALALRNNTVVIGHNNIASHPAFRRRITSGSDTAANAAANNLAAYVRGVLNNRELLHAEHKRNTEEKLKTLVSHIISARTKKQQYRSRQQIANALAHSAEMRQINNNARAANSETMKLILNVQKNNLRRRMLESTRGNSTHSQQILAWRWFRTKVLPKVFA